MALDARPDHVAVAVPDPVAAETFWREELGGARVSEFDNETFAGRQLRFANGGKVELLGPSPTDPSDDNFVRRFLSRFGTRVHHLTLLVPDLIVAIDELRVAGLDVVDVSLEHEGWKEAFLRPAQIGGLVVQVAQSSHTADEWARQRGQQPETPGEEAAAVLGPRLTHPDLDEAARLWELLGADIRRTDGTVSATWADAPIGVSVTAGDEAGPVALRVAGTSSRPARPGVAPALEST